jgi:hypothetical protein
MLQTEQQEIKGGMNDLGSVTCNVNGCVRMLCNVDRLFNGGDNAVRAFFLLLWKATHVYLQ